jgi:hypothetical protein
VWSALDHMGLPWSWLEAELATAVFPLWLSHVTGVMSGWDIVYTTPGPAPVSPDGEPRFRICPGESYDDARVRLRAELERVTKVWRDFNPKRQVKLSRQEINALQRAAGWVYQVDVLKHDVAAVARRSYPPAPLQQDRRKDVYDGLARARKLLAIAAPVSAASLPLWEQMSAFRSHMWEPCRTGRHHTSQHSQSGQCWWGYEYRQQNDHSGDCPDPRCVERDSKALGRQGPPPLLSAADRCPTVRPRRGAASPRSTP